MTEFIIDIVITVIGFIVSIVANSKITQYRIDDLSKRVDKHNTVIERTYVLEEKVRNLEKQNKVTRQKTKI